MSFNIERFGSDASNVKSILGGVCYYRYFNKDNNDVTVAGYFPASLGLQLGDRITVIPATKTNADEEYIVSDITNRVVTVTKVEAGGSVDLSKVVNADVLPTASADNLGYVYLYTGTTDANYTHGYIYECVSDGQNPATYSWAQVSVQPVPTAEEIGAVTQTTTTITLASTDWSSHTQTKTVSGVTADNTVIVAPASASAADYAAAEILCTAQGVNSLTFTCTTDPTNNISVNVVILN